MFLRLASLILLASLFQRSIVAKNDAPRDSYLEQKRAQPTGSSEIFSGGAVNLELVVETSQFVAPVGH